MSELENLSVNELTKQLEDSEPLERKDILKSVLDKSIDYVENYARGEKFLILKITKG